jgi:two-component system chemotaxis response regulator CheY
VRALVVDDSMTMRMMLAHLLKARGFQVEEATDGAHAMQLMVRGPVPDLVTLDWNMPVMGGGATLDAIRQNRAFDGVKILVISSETEQQRVADALSCGTDEYLMKPFSPEAFFEKVEMLGLNTAAAVPGQHRSES